MVLVICVGEPERQISWCWLYTVCAGEPERQIMVLAICVGEPEKIDRSHGAGYTCR
jgi:hypothetical protein